MVLLQLPDNHPPPLTILVPSPAAHVGPVCAKALKVQDGEDPNVTYDRHARSECDPSNYAKVHNKARCPVPGCREKLTSINAFTCKECGGEVCLKHRLATDHACPGKSASSPAWAAADRMRQSLKGIFGSNNGSSDTVAAAPAASQKPKAASSSGQSKLNPAAAIATASANVLNQLMDYRKQRTEQCPRCSERFRTVQALIDHASTAHADGWSSGTLSSSARGSATSNGPEKCPHCRARFADAVSLVNHVQTQHEGQAGEKEACVLC